MSRLSRLSRRPGVILVILALLAGCVASPTGTDGEGKTNGGTSGGKKKITTSGSKSPGATDSGDPDDPDGNPDDPTGTTKRSPGAGGSGDPNATASGSAGTASPGTGGSAAPGTSPVPSGGVVSGSASPSVAPSTGNDETGGVVPDLSDPNLIYEGTYKSEIIAGGIVGTPKDGQGINAALGRDDVSVGMGLEVVSGVTKFLWFTDGLANQVRTWEVATGDVAVDVGDPGLAKTGADSSIHYLFNPSGLVFDAARKCFYATDTGHLRILRIWASGASGHALDSVDVIAGAGRTDIYQDYKDGDGIGDDETKLATFSAPRGLALLNDKLYVADWSNHAIRSIDLASPTYAVTTIGGGTFTTYEDINHNVRQRMVFGPPAAGAEDRASAKFNFPNGLAIGGTTGEPMLLVADSGNHCIRAIDLSSATGKVSVYAGVPGAPGYKDGDAGVAAFKSPISLATDGNGNAYVGEGNNFRLRKITFGTRKTTTILGRTLPNSLTGDKNDGAGFFSVTGIAVDRNTDGSLKALYAFDAGPDPDDDPDNGPRIVRIRQ